MIEAARGRRREAADALRGTASSEDSLPFEFGPPFVEKPSRELLGEQLLSMNDSKGARVQFEQALTRSPERTASLAGLMKAAAATGDSNKAEEIRARLQTIRRRADHPMP